MTDDIVYVVGLKAYELKILIDSCIALAFSWRIP